MNIRIMGPSGGWTGAALCMLACAVPSFAQSNALWKRSGPAPGQQAAPTPAGGSAGKPRPEGTPPPANPVLLDASLIAAALPAPRTFKVHDQITVIIREEKRASTDAKLDSKKDWQISAELNKWFKLDERDRLRVQDFPTGTPGFDFDLQHKYKGEGKVGRQDTFTTRITATILDVKPNGVLVVEARKRIKIDEDEQIISLTGACRSDDVTADNTILSTQLADAEITAQHTGPARDAARRGWAARLWDLVRPF